jgi:hypothetical protein
MDDDMDFRGCWIVIVAAIVLWVAIIFAVAFVMR